MQKVKEKRGNGADLFKKVFEISPNPLALITIKESKFILVNKEFLKLTGSQAKEVVGKTLNEINIYANLENKKKLIKLIKEKNKFENFELEINARASIRTITLSGKTINFRKEKILVFSARDITNEIEKEKRLKDLIELSADFIWETDKNGKYTFVSKSAEKILGFSKEEMLGKTPFDFMDKKEAKKIKKEFIKIAAEKKPIKDLINWNFSKNGKKICLLTNGIPILNEKGDLIGYRGIDKDITENEQIEQKLREKEEIINRSPMVVFLWKNAEGWPVELVSENVKNLLGYTPKELMASKPPFSEIVYKKDLERMAKEVENYSKEKEKKEFKQIYRVVTKDGKIKWVEDYTSIKRNNKGKITHYQGILFDITEQKQAEEKISSQMEELKKFHDLTIDREFKMIELKKEINSLLKKLNLPEKYKIE